MKAYVAARETFGAKHRAGRRDPTGGEPGELQARMVPFSVARRLAQKLRGDPAELLSGDVAPMRLLDSHARMQ